MENIILSPIPLNDLTVILRDIVKNEVSKIHSIPKEEEDLLTRKEAASFLKICLPNLDELTRTGEIPASRIGTRVRYLKSDLINSLPRIKGAKS